MLKVQLKQGFGLDVFSLSIMGIRANQGHSIKINVEMQVLAPPDILFHGTAEKNLESIKKEGI